MISNHYSGEDLHVSTKTFTRHGSLTTIDKDMFRLYGDLNCSQGTQNTSLRTLRQLESDEEGFSKVDCMAPSRKKGCKPFLLHPVSSSTTPVLPCVIQHHNSIAKEEEMHGSTASMHGSATKKACCMTRCTHTRHIRSTIHGTLHTNTHNTSKLTFMTL